MNNLDSIEAAKRGFSGRFFDYLAEDLYTTPSNYNEHELSFLYTPEDEDEEIEVTFFVKCEPLDKNKKFVNLSFQYPDPDNIHDDILLVAEDQYTAVENSTDEIIKKCMDFIDKTYGVDTLEKIPDKITASVTRESQTIEAALSDVLRSFISDLLSPTEGEMRTEYEITDRSRDGQTLQYDINMYIVKDGKEIVEFPEQVVVRSEDEDKISVEISMPDPDNLDNLAPMMKYDKIDNSKQFVKDAILKSLSTSKDKYDMQKFMKHFATNKDIFDFTVTDESDTSEVHPDIGESEDIMDDMNVPITGSKVLKVRLQKIHADAGYNIELQNICASYSPVEALDDLNLLISDESFAEDLAYDEPVAVVVDATDEDLSVETFDEEDDFNLDRIACLQNSYDAILDCAWILYLDCMNLQNTACGAQMESIQRYASTYAWQVSELINTVSKMILEDELVLNHPINRITNFGNQGLVDRPGNTIQCTYWNDFAATVMQDIKQLVCALTLYACNLASDKYMTLQNSIRAWNYEIDYVLDRTRK